MKNKIVKTVILSIAAVLALNNTSVADTIPLENDNRQHKIKISEPVNTINDNLFNSKDEMLQYYLQNQKKMDIEDIKLLWESTVKRNPVITFALQKLALPPEKRRINSSRMTKTVATLIRGAAMLPGILGADPVASGASSVGGGVASRYISGKTAPKEIPITDTELIQLARLVESLQDKIIRNYYDYKANLEFYRVARGNAVQLNKQYSKALSTGDITSVITSGTMYNRARRKENEIKRKIKLNRLELERLAGVEAINNLNLGKAALPKNLKTKTASPKKPGKILEGNIDYFDTDIKALAEEIALEMQEEKQELLADLRILWAAAVENSETIRFAILKLSHPDGEVEKKSAVKKILSPLASVAPIVGLGIGDPVTAGTAMFSGNLLNSVLSDDSKINEYLSRVTDADLVMLAQETDSLQVKLITLYHNYLSVIIDLKMIDEMEKNSEQALELVKNSKPGLSSIAAAFHTQILDLKHQARQDVLSRRIALEQFVGNDALLVVDANIQDRLGYKL